MAQPLSQKIDWTLISLVFILSFLGLLLAYSFDPKLFNLQLSGIIIGTILMIFISLLPFLKLIQTGPFLYLINLFLLGGVFLFHPVKGAHRWLDIQLLNLQPSEFYKFTLVLASWWFLHSLPNLTRKKLPFKITAIITFFTPLIFILFEPDLGTTLFIGIALFIAWLPFLFSPKTLFLTIFSLSILTPFFWYQLRPYQRQRLTSFLNPLADPYKSGYNIIQAQLTIHNGGWWGKLNSTHKYQDILPEVKTDFIFSAWVEDTGFIGGVFLILLYALVFTRLSKIAASLPNLERIPLILIIFFIPFQALVHIAINLKLFPVTGLPLPFISYGRSSLITNFLLLGLLNSRLRYQGKVLSPAPPQPSPSTILTSSSQLIKKF